MLDKVHQYYTPKVLEKVCVVCGIVSTTNSTRRWAARKDTRQFPRENVRGPREDVRDEIPREDVHGHDGNRDRV